MALYYDLPVFKDVYKMTLRIFELTSNFSREYKYTLGQDLKRDCILLVRSIYRANKCKDKVFYLEQFLDSFEVVKLEVRLCTDLKLISIKQQAELALLMENIGKQITGWRNAQKQLQKPLIIGNLVIDNGEIPKQVRNDDVLTRNCIIKIIKLPARIYIATVI